MPGLSASRTAHRPDRQAVRRPESNEAARRRLRRGPLPNNPLKGLPHCPSPSPGAPGAIVRSIDLA